jgi:phosphatidate cytidylyltransferase
VRNLSRRTLTGIFLVIIVFGGLWLHPVSYLSIGLLLLAGSLYEYYRLIAATGTEPQRNAGILTAIIIYLISVFVAAGMIEALSYLLVMAAFLFIIIIELSRKKSKPFDSLAHTIFGIIFISLPYSLIPFLAFGFNGTSTLLPGLFPDFSPGIMLGFLLLSWSFDIAAYLFGSYLGKHKLFKRISPEKSWEGFAFGLLTALLIAWPVSIWITEPGLLSWMIIALLISIAGTLGDLVESMLKRSAGVKDSGTILPGHGGLLDRFDSLILSLPFVYLFVVLFC